MIHPRSNPRGIVACGHVETASAAAEVLRAGGNAFDAVIAALCAACVAEPLMVSLGGGGFLLARPGLGQARVYDFFCHTPARRRAESDMDFYPIVANFGADLQEFHIGMGAIAVPGTVAGLFRIHADLGRMPLREVVQPAIELASRGVVINPLQAYIVRILEAILRSHPAVFSLFESPSRPGALIGAGETLRNPACGEALDHLVREGAALFYRGEWAQRLARDSHEQGGNLELADLAAYRVACRQPLAFDYRGSRCLINPPPSPGGCLIAFALGLLEHSLPQGVSWGAPAHVAALIGAMRAASLARAECGIEGGLDGRLLEELLGGDRLAAWLSRVQTHSLFSRGTTHISVADVDGNLASLTASNGEGNRYILPGTGIMLNNMLGEEDLNPAGFNRWRPGTRLASMMSPLVAQGADGSWLALGTGGSNRIRSAIVQTLVNVFAFGQSLAAAVTAPRLHLENTRLSIEAGYPPAGIEVAQALVPEVHQWPATNLYFGGVQAVQLTASGGLTGAGDPRRDGVVEIA